MLYFIFITIEKQKPKSVTLHDMKRYLKGKKKQKTNKQTNEQKNKRPTSLT